MQISRKRTPIRKQRIPRMSQRLSNVILSLSIMAFRKNYRKFAGESPLAIKTMETHRLLLTQIKRSTRLIEVVHEKVHCLDLLWILSYNAKHALTTQSLFSLA